MTAKANHEDEDRVFVQASPCIFQMKQVGQNAKLPEVDLDDYQTFVVSTQISSEECQGRDSSLKNERPGEASVYMALKLTWAAQRTLNKRELVFHVAGLNDPAYDVQAPSSGAQSSHLQNANTQNHDDSSGTITNGIAVSCRTQHSEGLKQDNDPMLDESRELDVPRHVIWQ